MLKCEMMDSVDKDFIEALLKRNCIMRDISYLLVKRNPDFRGLMRSVGRFCRDHDRF